MAAKTVLIVDDHKETCQAIQLFLEFEGYRCQAFQEGGPALEWIEKEPAHAVLLDLDLGEKQMSGMDVLGRIKKSDPSLPVIILTGDTSVKNAVQAMKAGAYHYLTKPFDNDETVLLVRKAIDEREKSREIEILKARVAPAAPAPQALGDSPAFLETLALVEKVAATELTAVIQGESGSGKELIARLIHDKSPRRSAPFISLDCGTLQETLVESELFGYERGAFTGADKKKLGQFEIATGGTLFLDEIGNLPLPVQTKLLRVLQEKKIQHLGGTREIETDIRVIVASNQSLEGLTKQGKFREDLFHRLNQFTIWVPPLRKRGEDIPQLARHFLDGANAEMKKSVRAFSAAALNLMRSYSWPGNIRELRNAVYRATLLADADIQPEHLQISLTRDKFIQKSLADFSSGKRISLKKASRHAAGVLEKQMIEQVLAKCNNNKTLAAKRLRIDRKALYNKLKKYKLIRK